MKYRSNLSFTHAQSDKIGVLITNLGTPDAPTPKALRRYLKEFLSDPRVVEFPRMLWWLVLNGIILNFRPRRSAKSYKKVWTEEGSPLAVHTAKQCELLRKRLQEERGDQVVVAWGMRYGKPSISKAVNELIDQGARKLVVLPLYPQYSCSTTASTFDALSSDLSARRWVPELRFINAYHTFGPYIDALAASVQQYWDEHGKADKLLFSYHGVPLRYLHKGDPYHCQCLATSRLLAKKLGLKDDEFQTAFQSRFGREAWLQPYTDETLKALPSEGVKSVQVICPGFSADCLETIEEIGMENRDYFLDAGGEKFEYIPALNSCDEHIDALAELINQNFSGWELNQDSATSLREQRFNDCPNNQQK
ncbi:MAG: ferrochelatase [Agarilytica sp.]